MRAHRLQKVFRDGCKQDHNGQASVSWYAVVRRGTLAAEASRCRLVGTAGALRGARRRGARHPRVTQGRAAGPAPEHRTRKFAFIDALRGYAVLLVITSHVGGMFAELPYPVKKLTNFGWNGVQLFFLLSCVTLLLSWHADAARGIVDVRRFWLRRLFRIVPMYYLGAVFYFIAEPPESGFDLTQALASALFVNAWYPTLTPTVPGHWQVVPGGWSIGVEMTFYLLFPLIAGWVRSMRAALLFSAAALAAGCAANIAMFHVLVDRVDTAGTENFLYFWLPNQLVIFALGTVLYFGLDRLALPGWAGARDGLRRWSGWIIVACGIFCVLAANVHFPGRLPVALPLVLPIHVVAALTFMVAVAALASNPASLFINRAACAFGRVSFSAYLLHFFIIHTLVRLVPPVFDRSATGWRAIFVCAALWVCTVPLTYALSALTFRLVEQPMVSVGQRVLRRRQPGMAALGSATRL